MSPGPRGPANWVWARGGTRLSALHRWCETQPSLHTWNIQILPAASLWSCCNRQGKTERVGGRKQQKQEEEQHTWERTDWHFLRENKQSQVSCVAWLQLVVSGESGPLWWWRHLWSLPPLPLTDLNGEASQKQVPRSALLFPTLKGTGKQTLSPILLFKFDTTSALLILYASSSKNFILEGFSVWSRGWFFFCFFSCVLDYCETPLLLFHIHISIWASHLADWGYHVFSQVSTH